MRSCWQRLVGIAFLVPLATGGRLSPQTANLNPGPAPQAAAVCVDGRTDTRLTAVFGACVEDEFRHFTLWDAPAWDRLSWTTSGNFNAANLDWPAKEDNYSQSILLEVDGRPIVGPAMKATRVEHQFDCRRVQGRIEGLEIERVDMVISPLQLMTGLRLRNGSGKPVRLGITLRWEAGRRLGLAPRPEKGDFVINDPGGPLTLVAANRPLRATSDGGKVEASTEIELAANGEDSLILTSRIGWGPFPGNGLKMAVSRAFPPLSSYEDARPSIPCDARFRRVRTNRERAMDYVFKVRKNGRYRVAFGLIENTFEQPGERVLDLTIEGQTVGVIDMAQKFGKNVPAVLVFDAADADDDGALDIGIHPAKSGRVPDSLFSSIHVFEPASAPSPAEILAGEVDDRAVAFVRADRPDIPSKLTPPEIIEKQASEMREIHRLLGLPAGSISWQDLEELREAKRKALYDRMPRIEGFDASWTGAWSYIFDILRAGTYPAQGECRGPWIVGDLIYYRWTFYWDTALSAHTYAQWDASLAARTVETFLRGMREDGALPIHFNPVHVMPIQPQLPNIGMALWDAYQVSRDRSLVEETYPLLSRHQRWLDRKWNRTPDGPLVDTGNNIDYGTPLLEGKSIWVDMNVFQVDQFRVLASMAGLLGKKEEADEWVRRADRLADAVRRLMWDAGKGTFLCVDGRTMKRIEVGSPIEFFAMTTGVASREQAEKLVVRVRDPRKYAAGPGHPFMIPSAPFDDPSFAIKDGWGGTIWPVQPYYTVRGLARYGCQDDAASVARNIFGMVAAEFAQTGTVWEQYRPDNGRGMHLGLFTSGITVTVSDMLLRGIFGFERTDDPLAFFLTPRPSSDRWEGITNLRLSGEHRLDVRVKKEAGGGLCRIRFYGLPDSVRTVEIDGIVGNRTEALSKIKIMGSEIEVKLPERPGERFLFKLTD